MQKIDGAIHDVKNEKLMSLYLDTVQLKNKYKDDAGWNLSKSYHSMSNLGLLIAHVDTSLQYGTDYKKYLDDLEISISILRGAISDTMIQIEVKKELWFNFYQVEKLRNKRDRYVEILGMFQRTKAVIDYVISRM